MSVIELFCDVDDFCSTFEPKWHKYCLPSGTKQQNRRRELALSKIMTILILVHQSHYRDFKAFYTQHVCIHLASEFPSLVNYNRFIEFFGQALMQVLVYLHSSLGTCTGDYFVDATKDTEYHS